MSAPLRIALLTYSTKPRGSVIHTLELAEALQALGHNVCVYALDKDGAGFDRALSCDVKLISAKPAPAQVDALIRQRIEEFVDGLIDSSQIYHCYHAQDCISANALAILRTQGKIRHFIRTVHHIEDYQSFYLQQCQDRSIRDATLCLCVSDQWREALQQHYQINAAKVRNGVNVRQFSTVANGLESALKQRLALTGNPVYLTVGGIEPRKNSITLLEAFIQVRSQHPTAQLIIAGGATLFDYQDYRDRFFEIATSANLNQSLVLPGVLSSSELSALYRLADAFVFPSIKEGWGLVLLEAIASGLPVITSNQPPFTEFLSQEQALLVDPSSPSAIAHAMKRVIQPSVSQSLIEQSRSICEQYTWTTSAKLHLTHYYNLLHQYA